MIVCAASLFLSDGYQHKECTPFLDAAIVHAANLLPPWSTLALSAETYSSPIGFPTWPDKVFCISRLVATPYAISLTFLIGGLLLSPTYLAVPSCSAAAEEHLSAFDSFTVRMISLSLKMFPLAMVLVLIAAMTRTRSHNTSLSSDREVQPIGDKALLRVSKCAPREEIVSGTPTSHLLLICVVNQMISATLSSLFAPSSHTPFALEVVDTMLPVVAAILLGAEYIYTDTRPTSIFGVTEQEPFA
ncbi:hypothetical protein HGRIS_010546 [Hohenbuehelia grisea]|uniref:Uncharacterized protein n=1 Tax=Hohenbuehelia grisea TaxID=104357 RepID=A0ABR3IXE3_9AGAR